TEKPNSFKENGLAHGARLALENLARVALTSVLACQWAGRCATDKRGRLSVPPDDPPALGAPIPLREPIGFLGRGPFDLVPALRGTAFCVEERPLRTPAIVANCSPACKIRRRPASPGHGGRAGSLRAVGVRKGGLSPAFVVARQVQTRLGVAGVRGEDL